MSNARQPLAEVFGHKPDDMSPEAERHRRFRLCPYGNVVPSCTKDKAEDPLGTCSIIGGPENNDIIVTCPVRFRQNWVIATDAAEFFFPEGATWTTISEVRLPDRSGRSAGNIDLVLVQYDSDGDIVDYGAVEVQAVYISGNVRRPFEKYMKATHMESQMDWSRERNYPKADYLSSSRKRLAPQLMFKGGILNAWGRRAAVVLNRGFFDTLPVLTEVPKERAEIAWLVYDLVPNPISNRYDLTKLRTVYTLFDESLDKITRAEAGDESEFLKSLAGKLTLAQAEPHEVSPDTSVVDFVIGGPIE